MKIARSVSMPTTNPKDADVAIPEISISNSSVSLETGLKRNPTSIRVILQPKNGNESRRQR